MSYPANNFDRAMVSLECGRILSGVLSGVAWPKLRFGMAKLDAPAFVSILMNVQKAQASLRTPRISRITKYDVILD
jgi:hypothetical protein